MDKFLEQNINLKLLFQKGLENILKFVVYVLIVKKTKYQKSVVQ